MNDGRIEVVTGMASAAFVVNELPLGRRLDGRPLALAVSDDGNFVAATFDVTQSLLLGLDGTRRSLAVSGTSALAFRPSSSDLVSASQENRVWFIRQTQSGPLLRQIAGPDDGISTPTAVAFTASGSVLIANSGNSTVAVVDSASGGVSSISCGCNPVRLERLATPGLFRLSDPSGQPMYLFDAASGRALFVPPLPANPSQGQQN
jgi:DNA-binding beta-propeller fold protein YncE